MSPELTDFESELLALGLPLGTVFTLELRFGVRTWEHVTAATLLEIERLPGMSPERTAAIRALAAERTSDPGPERTGGSG